MDERDQGWVRPTVLHSPLDPTRARPEPWFVGSGRSLMILILSLCAVLLVARGVTMVWMAEAAWAWLQRAPSPSSAGVPAPLAPRPPLAPADVGERPRAEPIGNLAAAFGRESYPMEALRLGEQGRVFARLAIDVDGRPTGCTVTTSSRSPRLDAATCALAVATTRYRPAQDEHGRARPSRYDLKVRWTLED